MTWEESDRLYGRKVRYWWRVEREGMVGRLHVGELVASTAYLQVEVAPEVYFGTNKHSGEPVFVRWEDEHERYVQVQRWAMVSPDVLDVSTPATRYALVLLDRVPVGPSEVRWERHVKEHWLSEDGVLVVNEEVRRAVEEATKAFEEEMRIARMYAR